MRLRGAAAGAFSSGGEAGKVAGKANKRGRDPDKLPRDGKGDESSRMRSSEGPAEDREKREVVEKLRQQRDDRG